MASINASTSGAGGVITTADNTGILNIQTAGTNAVTITASQNVGIGITSPRSKFNVSGNTSYSGVANSIVFFQAAAGTENDAGVSIGSINGNTPYISATKVNNGSGSATPLLFYTDATERMRINSAGDVGLGTASPTSIAPNYTTLDIRGPSGGGMRNGIVGGTETFFYTDSGGSNMFTTTAISMQFGTNGAERMRITSGGEVYIAGTTDRGAFNLQCNGTGVWGAGAYTNGSDARIKDDIQPITSSLEVVNKLNPVTFKYKEDWSKDQSVQTGFIAQELQETLKDEIYIDGLVSTGGEYLSVAYQNIIPLLTKAIQEQQTIINDLKARIETLEAK